MCINQEDDAEKSWQVQLMGEIYKMAKLTYVWLGPNSRDQDEHSVVALNAIMEIENSAKATEC
jgi:Heterokaryon incompatibility protein (HET)